MAKIVVGFNDFEIHRDGNGKVTGGLHIPSGNQLDGAEMKEAMRERTRMIQGMEASKSKK